MTGFDQREVARCDSRHLCAILSVPLPWAAEHPRELLPRTWDRGWPRSSKGPGLVNPQLEASPAWMSRHLVDLPTQLEIRFRKSLDLNEQLLVGGPQQKYGALVATASSAYQYTSLLCVRLFKDASLTHCG